MCLSAAWVGERVRLVPGWVWAVTYLFMIPLGGILYLLVGRVWARAAPR